MWEELEDILEALRREHRNAWEVGAFWGTIPVKRAIFDWRRRHKLLAEDEPDFRV